MLGSLVVSGYKVLAILIVCLFEMPSLHWLALLRVILLSKLLVIAQGMLPSGWMIKAADFAANNFGMGFGGRSSGVTKPLLKIERYIETVG